MKTMFDIQEFAARIAAQAEAKSDYVVPTSALTMTVDDGKLALEMPTDPADPEVVDVLPIQQYAHGQIASRLDIPRKYYDRMAAQAPELLTANVNHWFGQSSEARMIRTIGGEARAFLSNRYQRIENEQIAEVVLPILGDTPAVRFSSLAITERKLYIKAVFEEVVGEVSVGDPVRAGVCITNSEVGDGAVNIAPFIERLVCTNGMVVSDASYRAYHIGGAITAKEGVAHILSDEAIRADDSAILLKVRDVLRSVVNQDLFNGILDRFRAARGHKIMGDVPMAVEVLAQKYALTKTEGSGVLRHLIEGGELSRYGMVNALTRYSQDVEAYDRAHDFEVVGGKVLDLPANQWSEIAQAA